MRRIAVTLAVSVALGAIPLAHADNAMIFGIGYSSCAIWTSDPDNEMQASVWVLGYWSGLNAPLQLSESTSVGKSTDAYGIIAEVKLVCKNKPSISIINATIETYQRLKREGR